MTHPAQTERARNRQKYNAMKSKMPLPSSSSSLPPSGQSLNGSDSALLNWRTLSSNQLLDLTEGELATLESQMSPSEKAELGQKLLQALNQPSLLNPQNPSFSFQPPKPSLSSPQNSPRAVPTPSIDASGVATSTESSQASTGYTNQSVPDEPPEGLDELRQPLTGKHKKQQNELEELFSLAGFLCVSVAQASGNQALYKDAETIGKYGENVAESWAKLARKYPWLYGALDRMIGAAAVGLMLTSTSKMMQELMENHGVRLPKFNLRRNAGMAAQPVPFAHAS